MLVTVEIDALVKQLEGVALKADQAFVHMVSRFTENVVTIASNRTRMGSDESIETGREDVENGNSGTPEAAYFRMYQGRNNLHGIPIKAGFHKGAWRARSSLDFQMDPAIYDTYDAANGAAMYVENNYTHGEDFWIGAKGPAFGMLNNADAKGNHTGYSLGDVVMEDILEIYAMGPLLKQYFNEVMPE